MNAETAIRLDQAVQAETLRIDQAEFRLHCALVERDKATRRLKATSRRLAAHTATPPPPAHCAYCGQPRCECGLADYITEAPR